MFEKRRKVICGLAVAGMRRTGTAEKRPPLIERSPAHLLVSTKGGLARRDRRRAACAIGAAHPSHCTDASHSTVRTHPLQVCLAPVDEAPIGFARGRHWPRAAAVGPGADARDMTGDGRREEAGK